MKYTLPSGLAGVSGGDGPLSEKEYRYPMKRKDLEVALQEALELLAHSGWISVEDELPEDNCGGEVTVYYENDAAERVTSANFVNEHFCIWFKEAWEDGWGDGVSWGGDMEDEWSVSSTKISLDKHMENLS